MTDKPINAPTLRIKPYNKINFVPKLTKNNRYLQKTNSLKTTKGYDQKCLGIELKVTPLSTRP